MSEALEGIRVLDFTRGMAGPLATMILADYGAEVIRVEPPEGDPLWFHPAYLLWNRGKKSIDLDLRSEEGREHARRLIGSADVLVEGFRPGTAESLGLGYEVASAINPALVYCTLSAFGAHGPYSQLRAYDGIVNAKAGRMRDQVGHYRNRPIYRAVNDTSYHTAMFALQGILAALRVVWITGRGQLVETSLLRGTTAPNNAWRRFDGADISSDLYPGEVDPSEALRGELVADRYEANPLMAIPSQLCTECKDGRWIMHSHVQYELFRAWIWAIGFEWIWEDARYRGAPTSFPRDEDRIELNQLIRTRMKEKTAQEWIDIYRANPDCAGEIMQTTQEALHHPQFLHNGHLVTLEDPRVGRMEQVGPFVTMETTPAQIHSSAPIPGQDTDEVLRTIEERQTNFRLPGSDPSRPLEGVVMLEVATWLAAPFAGALLADLGARVIKIEPLTGDPFRRMTTNENMIRATQGKETIAVDLKTEEGQQVLQRLVARADVLMHNFRPGAPARIGLDYETVASIKPDIVYLYAASYGSTGPDCMRAAFNPTIGAFSGNSVFQSGEGNAPIGDQSPDPISGSGVATGIMLGLAARWRTGHGQYLETTMMNSVVYCNSDDALNYEGKPPRRVPDALQLGLEATYRLYETTDAWIFLAAPSDDEFRVLCEETGLQRLVADPLFAEAERRYENRRELGGLLEAVFSTATADEWEARLTAAHVACVRADKMSHRRFLYDDPHTKVLNFMVPTAHPLFASNAPRGRYWRHGPQVDFSSTPCEIGKPFVALGEWTIPILEELGYSAEEIRQLKKADIVDWPEVDPSLVEVEDEGDRDVQSTVPQSDSVTSSRRDPLS